ncbi:MAG: SIS domain-containing protein [Anaerolineales bacterium]
MTPPGHHTYAEIISQPDAWAAALAMLRDRAKVLSDFYRAGRYQAVLFTGCGSPYYLALSAAAMFQELAGVPARAAPAAEVWLSPNSIIPHGQRTLLVAFSRSGETTETLRACETFRARGGDVLTLSCYPSRPLTSLGAVNLILPSGQEHSLAQTRAFTVLYLATLALVALWSDRAELLDELTRLPTACQSLFDKAQTTVQSYALDAAVDRFYFLGSGPRYGLACEMSLKMKEMSLSHSEPFYFLEFRHGPKSMVTPTTLIVGLVSETNRAHEMAVLEEMRAEGARTLTLAERDADVSFASGVSEAARTLLALPAGQLLAYERALRNGLNPDRPHNLNRVVTL